MRSVRRRRRAALSLLAVSSIALAAEPSRAAFFRIYPATAPAALDSRRREPYSVTSFIRCSTTSSSTAGRGANSMDSIVRGPGRELGLDSDNKTLTFKLRRTSNVHDGKPFTSADGANHLRHADGQVATEFARNRAELVRVRQRCHHFRRFRGRVQFEAAAAGAAGDARLRLDAGLSLP